MAIRLTIRNKEATRTQTRSNAFFVTWSLLILYFSGLHLVADIQTALNVARPQATLPRSLRRLQLEHSSPQMTLCVGHGGPIAWRLNLIDMLLNQWQDRLSPRLWSSDPVSALACTRTACTSQVIACPMWSVIHALRISQPFNKTTYNE